MATGEEGGITLGRREALDPQHGAHWGKQQEGRMHHTWADGNRAAILCREGDQSGREPGTGAYGMSLPAFLGSLGDVEACIQLWRN